MLIFIKEKNVKSQESHKERKKSHKEKKKFRPRSQHLGLF